MVLHKTRQLYPLLAPKSPRIEGSRQADDSGVSVLRSALLSKRPEGYGLAYLISRCTVILLKYLLYFLSSSRCESFFLFFCVVYRDGVWPRPRASVHSRVITIRTPFFFAMQDTSREGRLSDAGLGTEISAMREPNRVGLGSRATRPAMAASDAKLHKLVVGG
mmetsp:Transcript_5054/g.14532  ORF Transcript_5054/g.14532 Transcript_5054/m.14532 type:complete len:163 (+) Transcript_5054:176-664(+)